MKYKVIAVGKLKREFIKAGCLFYSKRLTSLTSLGLKEIKAIKGSQASQRESMALLDASEGFTVSLDEKGMLRTSQELAEHVTKLEHRGVSLLNLLIGGADGHSHELKARVDESWSLSPLTLPHELARLVLLEQLYRVETIRAGHPYHRE